MNEIRFSYYPKKDLLLLSNEYSCHGDTIQAFNKGKAKQRIPYDNFIRGIIKEGILYLRLYYPLPDINEKTIEQITEYSYNIQYDNKHAIIKALKVNGIKKPCKIVYNVVNADLKGILTNI